MELRIFTATELAEIIRKHGLWIAGEEGGEYANLSYADLRNANLRYANLSNANLRYANLSNANLSYANLTDANLRYANLSYADLSYANLRYADLRYANLRCANLRNADLSYANLRYADLRYANLSYANLTDANLILIGQDIRGYLFYGWRNEEDVLIIHAGCRRFVGIAAARAHWEERHVEDAVLHEDCLSLVDRAERMAKARGWKTEPTPAA